MASDEMRAMNEQMERITGPWQRMAALSLQTVERLADFQFHRLQTYTHLAMRQWRDMLEVRDDRSLREFLIRRQEAAQQIGQQVSEDARALAEIGQEFTQQLQRVTEQNVRGLSEVTRAGMDSVRQRGEQAERARRRAS